MKNKNFDKDSNHIKYTDLAILLNRTKNSIYKRYRLLKMNEK